MAGFSLTISLRHPNDKNLFPSVECQTCFIHSCAKHSVSTQNIDSDAEQHRWSCCDNDLLASWYLPHRHDAEAWLWLLIFQNQSVVIIMIFFFFVISLYHHLSAFEPGNSGKINIYSNFRIHLHPLFPISGSFFILIWTYEMSDSALQSCASL